MTNKKATKYGKKKYIKDTNKIVLEFDNPITDSENQLEKNGIDNDNFKTTSDATSLDTPLSVPSFNSNIPKKTSFGGFGKKIKGIFHKKKKPSISDSTNLSSQDQRGEKKKSEMSELEKLEYEFQQKKELIRQKQELEIQKKQQEQRLQQQKILEQQKKLIKVPIKTIGSSEPIHQNISEDIELNPFGNLDPINYCQNCGKKLKKGKIEKYENGYTQEINCKRCGFQTEIKIRI